MNVPNIHDPSGHGICNPLDDAPDDVELTIEMFDGRELTKEELINEISKSLKRVSARECEHSDGFLNIEIPFKEEER